MGTGKKRVRPQRVMTLSNECWDTLSEIAEASGDHKMSKSKVVELLAQFWRDVTLDETATYLANKILVRMGKEPYENENKSYQEILKGSREKD